MWRPTARRFLPGQRAGSSVFTTKGLGSTSFYRGIASVEIYTTTWCPYCVRAKKLLTSKGVTYKEINIEQVDGGREEMGKRTDRQTVPQIFIDGKGVGGSDELHALDAAGKLDALLGLTKK